MLGPDSRLHRLQQVFTAAKADARRHRVLHRHGYDVLRAPPEFPAGVLAGHGQGQPQPPTAAALIMMDAWTIIDAVNRLRALAKATRGLRRGLAVVSFYRSVEDVETLRNAVRHLIGEVQELEKNGRPLWGSLSWHYMESPATGMGEHPPADAGHGSAHRRLAVARMVGAPDTPLVFAVLWFDHP